MIIRADRQELNELSKYVDFHFALFSILVPTRAATATSPWKKTTSTSKLLEIRTAGTEEC